MIVFAGNEFKQFWEDDDYWQHGSLSPHTLSVKKNGLDLQEEDIDDIARELNDDERRRIC